MKKTVLAITFVLSVMPPALALEPEPDAVFVRVVDVGAGLCCVVKMPDDHYMIYDAGNYMDRGESAYDAIKDLVPQDAAIDLLVLSHTDADHLAAVEAICDRYEVKKVLRTGMKRDSATWRRADRAIYEERRDGDCLDINLRYFEFPPGATYRFGETFVTMVCGFHEPPKEWGQLSSSERRNAGSVVVRVAYKGGSILFCGDSVGRHIGQPADACIAAEKFMVDMSPVITIDSNVIVAPHHGADNASSTDFIKAVSPKYVIFSAGHHFEHPRALTAQRYINKGVVKENIFRTDRGDNEGGDEWESEDPSGPHDRIGDDDVDVLIRQTGEVVVEYRDAP